MSKENANLKIFEIKGADSFDFNELENKLQSELEFQLSDLDVLKDEKKNIGNDENLGNIIKDVVWEQFLNQVAAKAGEDFIKENKGLTLDLRKEAHIQTTENFDKGIIATHNSKIDYQQRHDDYQARFQKDEMGKIKTKYDSRSGKEQKVLNKGARGDFDRGRDKGSASVHKDHTISTAEINRDAEANAHLGRAEQVAFANSEKNLNDLDSSANQSKGDSNMYDWLKSERDGKKPVDRFNINEKKLKGKYQIAREEYENIKQEGIHKSKEAGKQSRKEESFKMTGKALRTAVMLIFAEFIKEIIGKLIKWLKSAQKNLNTLIEHIKEAINSFIVKLKTHLINASNSVLTTIFVALVGPIVRTLKKVWILLKQGWKSVKEAVEYLKNPENEDKPLNIRLLEVGKIVMAGLSAVSAIVLGEAIEKSLMVIPFLAVEIPLLGSLANLIGLFAGGLTAGIIGAIVINLIDKAVQKEQKNNNVSKQIKKSNEILSTQSQLIELNSKQFAISKEKVTNSIAERNKKAKDEINKSLNSIFNEDVSNSKNENSFDEMERILKGLLD
ncbi:cation diffusion facilitator family transporter [Alkalicoccobacillus porphyridii]|uniref:Cation diffusion facilitator family transporter n=1 Tax=Alkalicoccobacillus porphyridii TaxID=2597270 RepID=A0A553ZV25_9BACI|nr:cation diffusion facilitator family transporter [Alkalicoccobacillus porphyridii]TSB45341.1 cation diffusion facilitator family transporter [Alkalicoccobacillus porphyridii]